MHRDTKFPLFPVTGWDCGFAVVGDIVLLRARYVVGSLDNPYWSPLFSLSPNQALELGEDIVAASSALLLRR